MSVVSKLQIVLEATTTAFDRGLRSAQNSLDGFARRTQNLHDRMDRFVRQNQATISSMQQIGAVAGVGLVAVGAGMKVAVDEAVKFESAMAGVKKVIDFDTPQAFKQMGDDLIKMSQQIPMSAEGLANIMASAGQAGIAQADLARFTETAAKMGVAFDITAEQAGQAMAEMRVAFNMSQAEVETLADKINYLGNNSPNTAAQILEVVQRVGSLGEVAGVSSDTIAALTASLTGIAPEVAATSLKNFMLQLTKGEALSKSAKVAFTEMGLDYNQVAKGMQEDSNATITTVLQAVQKVPEHLRTAILNNAFGSESITAISQLVTNYDNVATHLQSVGDASKYAGSMLKEFESMAGTTQAQMQLFDNNITAVKIALGTALLPTINDIIQALTPMLQAFTQWASANPELISNITIATTAVLGLGVAIGAIGVVIPAIVSGVGILAGVFGAIGSFVGMVSSAVSMVGLFGGALATLGFPVTAVVAGITALVVAGVALYKNWDTIKARAVEIFGNLPAPVQDMARNIKAIYDGLVSFLSKAFEFLVPIWTAQFNLAKTVATGAFDFIKGYVALWVNSTKAILTAGLTVFASVFNAGFALIKNAFTTTFAIIKALVRGDMQGVANAIRTGLSNALAIVRTMIGNIVGAFKNLGSQLMQAGRDAIQGFINGVKAKMGEALATARQMASQVVSTVKSALDIHSPSRVMRELGAWAGEGFVLGVGDKVGDAKQVAENLANALTSTIADLHRQHFMLMNDGNPLADLDYKLQFGELAELTDKQKERLRELAKINLDIQTANEATAQAMREQETAQDNLSNKIKSYQDSLAKNTYLYRTKGDKYAGERWDLLQQGFDGKYIDQMIETLRQSDVMSAMANMPKTLTMPTLQNNNLGSAVSSAVTGYFDLKKQLDDNLAIIKEAENAKLITEQESQLARLEQEKAFHEARQNLVLSGGENVAKSLADSTKSLLGENSKAYRAMFAIEKGFAIARSVMAIQQAIALAAANPFPMNLGAMATVASQVAGIVGSIKAVQMPVGQAHDGIMSVPKSGTWNLEKGERVLPRHTAQNLDNTLNNIKGGKAVNVIIHNHTGERVQQTTDSNGDIRVIIGQELAKQLPQHVNNPYSDFNKSLKQNYNLERKL